MADTIGERIELALAKNNMTRKELTEKSGINAGTLSKYIKNRNIPSIESVKKMATALNIHATELVCFNGKDYCNFYKKNKYQMSEINTNEYCITGVNNQKNVILKKQTFFSIESNDKSQMNFGEKIRNILNISDMMIKELGSKTGKHPDQITAYIHGRKNPSLSTIELFADALQVSPSWLAGFIDIDTRNTFVMADNSEETMYLHPSQYIIKEIKDNGDTIILEKIKKE